MKLCIIILLFTGFSASAQKQDIQKSIEIIFDGFHERDTVKMQSVCSTKIILQSISKSVNKGNKLSDENAKEFYKSIASIQSSVKFQEKILSYNIQIDGTMAHVWAPYEFYLNGKLSHTGVNTLLCLKKKMFGRLFI